MVVVNSDPTSTDANRKKIKRGFYLVSYFVTIVKHYPVFKEQHF
ncbi:hypothetical protein NY10_741 [Carnobacterium antarcticum]|nr:hypothetical protein NY10_733 [Carnobacterium sp. CP1]ALV21356.1 hypothetical protein NY10_741 [Carnobacterium sp. CP1]